MLRFASAPMLLVLLASAVGMQARQTAARHAGSLPGLAEFEGAYEYHSDARLFIVSDRDRLVAVLGDGKYPLRRAGADTFVNSKNLASVWRSVPVAGAS